MRVVQTGGLNVFGELHCAGVNPDDQCRQHTETRDQSKENIDHSENTKVDQDWEVRGDEQGSSLYQRFIALLAHQVNSETGSFQA